MAFIPTTISAAVGDKSMGKPAPNKADDVKKIQSLLRKALGSSLPVLKDGVCDAALITAIATFQKLWGASADGTIEPPRETLKRLDRMANPLVLKPITMSRVTRGGYVIGCTGCDGGALPPAGKGYTLHLGFHDLENTIEVTNRAANDFLGSDNLGAVLTIFQKLNRWATPVQCQLHLKYKGVLISSSNTQTLNAPVKPHNGCMLPLDEVNNGAKLTYQGDPQAKDFHGRMFYQVPGYDKYVFVYAGMLETNTNFRGFDCITYAGTTCGASIMHMAESDDLATSLGATTVSHVHKSKDDKTGEEKSVTVTLESADPAHVKEFFVATSTGYFLMWSGGHIVIVADGEVHEFKAGTPSGYSRRPVADWLEPYKKEKLTVRKLPSKPARAE